MGGPVWTDIQDLHRWAGECDRLIREDRERSHAGAREYLL